LVAASASDGVCVHVGHPHDVGSASAAFGDDDCGRGGIRDCESLHVVQNTVARHSEKGIEACLRLKNKVETASPKMLLTLALG
jgi:hypothetical protein